MRPDNLSPLSNRFWFCAVAIALSFPLSTSAQKPLKVTQRWLLGGDGSWDYITFDPLSQRLYIAHQTRVDVIAAQTGRIIGAVQGLTRCHGIVILPDGKTGFVTDGGASAVVIFDTATLKTLGKIPAGMNPDGLLYEAFTKTLWAFNNAGGDVTVIDPSARTVLATLHLPGKPEFPATDNDGTIFVNIEDKNSIVKIDARAKKVVADWPLKGCKTPSGLALDKVGKRLFSVCDNRVMAVTDASSGNVLETPAIGEGPDAAVYDPSRRLAFSSNGDGTLTVLSASSERLNPVQAVPTMKGARTLALDASTGVLYTVSAQLGPTPEPTPEKPHPRPSAVPGTFTLMAISNE